ncbi:MAG: hypothetical protein HQ580_02680 [Planctomycetes bacterium]|nr:hypothetical protein [Planctomycetota bacterium]
MKHLINNPVKVFATGFIVLVLLSLPLFYIRITCEASLLEGMLREVKSVSISPSGLVPDEYENDPNVAIHSKASAHMRFASPKSLGIFDYFQARLPGGRLSNVYFFGSDEDCMYFDKKSGLIVHHYFDMQVMPDKRTTSKRVQIYIGPEGVSENPDKTLGRFIDPIIDRGWTCMTQRESRELILYGKELRRFFKIDSNKGTVTKGPELKKGDPPKPIQIGLLCKNYPFLHYFQWTPPKIKDPDEDPNKTDNRFPVPAPKPVIPTAFRHNAGPYLLVLDKSGRIYQLDKETLKFVQVDGHNMLAGRLPRPESYFGTRSPMAKPQDLLGYEVWPLALTTHFFGEDPESKKVFFGEPPGPIDPSNTRIERKYLGMFAASLSRNGTALTLSVFDEKGREIKSADSNFTKREGSRNISSRSSKAVFFRPPFASTFTIVKYLAENLHPPILSLASYFTASTFEAAAGHRGLFLLPNSFVAMHGRDFRGNFEGFMSALWWISPSIILAIWLATRVSKNAVVVGLSENARLYWILGTLAFGLAAYITYRLTRPKITLVTCQNCGKMRRPDMDRCHRCKSDWLVPELTPPAWRVLDGTEQKEQAERADEGSIADVESAEDAAAE